MAVSTINAVMRMRRGLEDDLDISKLQVGEWALSTDTKFVRICYAPNKVIQIASKEAMDETLAEIEQILEDIEQDKLDVEGYMQTTLVYKNAAAASATQASNSATASDSSAEDSEAWAVGKRDGVDVPSTDPAYHNNSKYWAEHSVQSLGNLTDTDISNPSNNDVLKYNSTTQKWENGTGGSGSGGHIIQNADGTDLAQRAKLQFGGMLKTTDDSENGVTKVSDLAEEIDWSVWNAMTEAQRTAYSAGKKLDIINVPSVSGSIPVELIKTLWTNPNPSASFEPQNVTLSSDDYDLLLIIAYLANTSQSSLSVMTKKGDNAYVTFADLNSSGVGINSYRNFNYVSDTQYSVTNAYLGGNTRVINNDRLVPTAIYGIKSSVNVDMSALVANVSTSASKCMLSDGETSVEDVLDGLTSNNMGAPELVTAGTAYTTPSNGYIQIYVKANSEIDVSVLSSGNNNGVRFDVINTASSGIYEFTYVNKGLRILWSASTANNGAVSFSPLV